MKRMTHKDVTDIIDNAKPVEVKDIFCHLDVNTGKYYATCYTGREPITQWGKTEDDALKKLHDYVVNVHGHKWPEVTHTDK